MLTVDEAVKAVRDGEVVKMVCGVGDDDPVCLVWNDGGMVMSASIAGWSAGVNEPVCGVGSGFLFEWFGGPNRSMTIADEDETARARSIRYEW